MRRAQFARTGRAPLFFFSSVAVLVRPGTAVAGRGGRPNVPTPQFMASTSSSASNWWLTTRARAYQRQRCAPDDAYPCALADPMALHPASCQHRPRTAAGQDPCDMPCEPGDCRGFGTQVCRAARAGGRIRRESRGSCSSSPRARTRFTLRSGCSTACRRRSAPRLDVLDGRVSSSSGSRRAAAS